MHKRLERQISVSTALGMSVSQNMRSRIELLSNDPLFTKDLAVDGKWIMQTLRWKAGPVVGRAMSFLMDRVLLDPKNNTQERLRALLIDMFVPNENCKIYDFNNHAHDNDP